MDYLRRALAGALPVGLAPWCVLYLSLLAVPMFGVTIQDASLSSYTTGASNFTGVVEINFDIGGTAYLCSGALISPTYVLTAGHCVNGASNWSVTFQTPTDSDDTIGGIAGILDPSFNPYPSGPLSGIDQYDVAVIQLASAAPSDATVYTVDPDYTCASIQNALVDIVGYGLGGNPAAGILSYGTRRAAQQVIQGCYSSLNGVSTPDSPLEMAMSFSSRTPAGFGLINGGDSGGPALLGNEIVGVADFGNLPETGDYASNTMYITGHANLSDPQISGFIDQYAEFVAPEPGTSLLSVAGLLLAAICVGFKRRSVFP